LRRLRGNFSDVKDRSGAVKFARFYVLLVCFGGDRDILVYLMSDTRCFPPPWSVEEQAACFVVRNANGQALSYVYFEEEPRRRFGGEVFDAARDISSL
jgi:hypothetical protein